MAKVKNLLPKKLAELDIPKKYEKDVKKYLNMSYFTLSIVIQLATKEDNNEIKEVNDNE